MELTANKRPFSTSRYANTSSRNFHVRHRLERYRAGRRMDYDDSPPKQIAEAIAQEIGRDVDYRGRRDRTAPPGRPSAIAELL